jgi:hypothetical protein
MNSIKKIVAYLLLKLRDCVALSGLLAIFILVGGIFVSVIMLIWGFVVPQIFPGAVAQGLIPPVLSWPVAVALFVALIIIRNLLTGRGSSK